MVINRILRSVEMYGISQNQVLIDLVQLPHNNSMQRTALRAAADAERWAAPRSLSARMSDEGTVPDQ